MFLMKSFFSPLKLYAKCCCPFSFELQLYHLYKNAFEFEKLMVRPLQLLHFLHAESSLIYSALSVTSY